MMTCPEGREDAIHATMLMRSERDMSANGRFGDDVN
jgi:hypothetical protein